MLFQIYVKYSKKKHCTRINIIMALTSLLYHSTDEDEGGVEEEKEGEEEDEEEKLEDEEDVIIEEVPRDPPPQRNCPAHMYECKDTGKCIMIYQR